MTPETRGRAGFELLRFTAAPGPGALVVLELEGVVARLAGRFARQPVLVVEADERPRLELAPVRATLEDGRWRGAYAVPAEALGDGARLALGLRGALLELPAPDEPGNADRLTALAREANGLRRLLEAAEAEALAAREDAAAAAAALEAAVAGAREEERAASAQRIDDLEHEVVEAHRLAAADVAEARAAAIAETAAAHDAQADARLAEAQREIETLRGRLAAAEAGTDVLRAELAEERERARTLVAADPDEGREEPGAEDADDADDLEDATDADADAEHADAEHEDDTQPFSVAVDPARDERVLRRAGIFDPLPADAPEHVRHGPNLSPWIAVGALLIFAAVLLGLLLGVLG